jgi:pilus assembly protein Flp/PilA
MRTRIKEIAVRLWKDESGATMIEYSVLIGLITAALVVLIGSVQGEITEKWQTICTQLNAGKAC